MSQNANIPTNKAFACISALILVIAPSLLYWSYGGDTLFGNHAFLKLMALSAFGGGLSFALFADEERRMSAILPGIIAGTGAAAALILYAIGMHRTSLYRGEIAIIILAGAVPGFVLLSFLSRSDPDRPLTSVQSR